MNNLLVALFAAAFTFGSTAVFAGDGDMKPLTAAEIKEQRAEARDALANMTPEQRAAMRKASQGKKPSELSIMEQMNEDCYNASGYVTNATTSACLYGDGVARQGSEMIRR